jgi:hypothetical protein
MNTQIDMNFGSLNQIEMVMEIEKGFKIKSSASGRKWLCSPATQQMRDQVVSSFV